MKKRTEELKELIDEAKNKISDIVVNLPGSPTIIKDTEEMLNLVELRVKYETELSKIGE